MEIPEIVQKQAKSLNGTALSFYKAGMGAIVQNFAKGMSLAQRNASRLGTKQSGDSVQEPPSADDAMRIDSDDIHYHIQPPPQSSMVGAVLKLGLGAALAGTGVGAAFSLPTIASGVMDLLKPAVAPAEPAKPAEPAAPTVNIGGQEYELRLGRPDE